MICGSAGGFLFSGRKAGRLAKIFQPTEGKWKLTQANKVNILGLRAFF
jgi:hypothetical protein